MLLAAAILCVHPYPVAAQEDPERALRDVRSRIEQLTERLGTQRRSRDSTGEALERIERELGRTTRELAELDRQVAELEERGRELESQATAAERRLGAERGALAEQVRVSYMTGREELFKLLLSQDSPATLGRMMVYYDYMNRARSERIDDVSAELESLAALASESAAVERRLTALQAETRAERDALEGQRAERGEILARLDAELDTGGAELDRLEREEARLTELIDRLDEALAAFPVDAEVPFAELAGSLAWPVNGTLISDFGQPRSGGPLRWNGVLLESPRGTPVRAVYRGRVAFADWLPGLGLLMIVDHGDGYMSLYGHNEALLKESGDWVSPGEAIARVGDTGGQPRASLYFEIRRRGEPVDPNRFARGVPGTAEP